VQFLLQFVKAVRGITESHNLHPKVCQQDHLLVLRHRDLLLLALPLVGQVQSGNTNAQEATPTSSVKTVVAGSAVVLVAALAL
jgi:hypothetical protein